MRQIFLISLVVFTIGLMNSTSAQIVWQENFNVADKGVWANDAGDLLTNFSGVSWSLDYSACNFVKEGDYAKTVNTSGGRFEVQDTDGELVWMSEYIHIAEYDAINLYLDASETGSNEADDKKYLKAYYKLNSGEEIPFTPTFEAIGNFGITQLKQSRLVGDSVQLIIKMNSSYASDKVTLDNILVEAIDSISFTPVEIKIIKSPIFSIANDTVVIKAAAANAEGSVLSDSTIKLTFESDDLNMLGVEYAEGVYSWSVLPGKDGIGNYHILNNNELLESIDSSVIVYATTDVELNELFEDNSLQGWNMNPDWEISTLEPINGNASIKHALENTSGTSILSYTDNGFDLAKEDYLFSFRMKNGQGDPSLSNSFYVWLKTADNNGYMIGVNANGNSDLVSIWKVINGLPDLIIAASDFDWNEYTEAQVIVKRTAWGEWELIVVDDKNSMAHFAMGFDSEFQLLEELRVVYNYTSTRAGQLWFDDMVILSQNAAPFIVSAKAIAADEFEVVFNEALQMSELKVSNMSLSSNGGQQFNILSYTQTNDHVIVIKTVSIIDPLLTLTVNNLKDVQGQTTAKTTIEFENALPAMTADVIINEIMADPSPVVGLPEAEYIELYNRSSHYIQLNNWELFVRNTSFKLPEKLIAPSELLIVCGIQLKEKFEQYGDVLAMEDFPAILNSGALIQLSDADALIIDEVSFTDEWYFDKTKSLGGYSLERIDLDRFCGQWGNWSASVDSRGGTPGTINSIAKSNPDSKAPEIIAMDIVSYTQLELLFNEPLDSSIAALLSNYRIQGMNISSVKYNPGELTLRLELQNAIALNTEYQLTVKTIADECGNSSAEITMPFTKVTLAEGQVLINEVLFNPYSGGADFVELYNNSGLTIDLADLSIATRDDAMNLKSVYPLSNLHVPFGPDELLVFTKDTASIIETYYVPYPEHLIQMSEFPSFNNEEGRVVLLNDSLVLIDEFAYSENMHSDWLDSYDGVSLERLSLEVETNDPNNWQSASSLVGYATPGYENSQREYEKEDAVNVSLESDVVSPNGDNFNDELVLNFTITQADYLANVYVFNAGGQEVKRLTNNDLIGNMQQVVYDLRDEEGSLLPLGIYLVYTELVHPMEKVRTFKKAFVITDK